MPIARYQLPDGRIARFEVPEGTSPQQAQKMIEGFDFSQTQQPTNAQNIAADAKAKFGPEDRMSTPEFDRQAGLTARYLVKGAASIPEIIGNAANTAINYGIKGINSIAGTEIPILPMASDSTDSLLDKVGLPRPETDQEKLVGAASTALAGQGAVIKAASNAPAYIQSALASNPGLQAASAVSGGAAGEKARQEDVGIFGQMLAALTGSLAPYAANSGLSAATRGVFRGGESGRKTMENNLQDFGHSGGKPSVGQATQNRRTQVLESVLSRTPGSSGLMAGAAEDQTAAISNKVNDLASSFSQRADPTFAGLTIKKGIGNFIGKYKTKSAELYKSLDDKIGANSPVMPEKTLRALDDLTAEIEGSPNLSKGFLKSAELAKLKEQIGQDIKKPDALRALGLSVSNRTDIPRNETNRFYPGMTPQWRYGVSMPENQPNYVGPPAGTIPYESLKRVRSVIGDWIDSDALIGDPANKQLKRLYAALSQDMKGAAEKAGALNEWNRANGYVKAAHARVDDILQPIINQSIPEKIYQAATGADMKVGATKINSIMRSLDPDQQKIVTATFLQRMGRALPGQQGADGGSFSLSTFLTNWSKLSPQAKSSLFNRAGYGRLKDDLNSIAKVAENVKQGSKVFSNPSGTQQAMSLQMVTGGSALAALMGRVDVAAGLLATVAASNGSARLMTNPRFVKWLAISTRVKPSALPAALNNLAAQSDKMNDEDRQAVLDFINQTRQTEAKQQTK